MSQSITAMNNTARYCQKNSPSNKDCKTASINSKLQNFEINDFTFMVRFLPPAKLVNLTH